MRYTKYDDGDLKMIPQNYSLSMSSAASGVFVTLMGHMHIFQRRTICPALLRVC
jgi:hypothetical protein